MLTVDRSARSTERRRAETVRQRPARSAGKQAIRQESPQLPAETWPEPVETDPTDRQFITALSRGLAVLGAFRPGDPPLSNGELVRRTGLPKPTVFRITHTLTALGYLSVHRATGRYVLCPHVLSLGYPVLAELDVRQVTRPWMQEIALDVKGTVALGMRTGMQMIYIERVRHFKTNALQLDIGSRMPLETSAMGRAYLAGLDRETLEIELQKMRMHRGAEWPDLLRGIETALKSYRETGYITAVGSWHRDINGVGVPMKLADGTVVGLTIGGPNTQITKELLPELGQRLIKVAAAVKATQAQLLPYGSQDAALSRDP